MMGFNTPSHVLDYHVHFERAFFMYTMFYRFVHDSEVDVHDTNLSFLVSLSAVDRVPMTALSQNLPVSPISFRRYLLSLD